MTTDLIFRQLIDGAWTDALGGRTWEVIDPATEDPIARVPFGDASDCRMAIDAAARAFPAWSARTPQDRGAILRGAAERMRARAPELGRLTTRESGKPLGEAVGEWKVAADLFEWYAEEGKRAYGRIIPARVPSRRHLVLRQPLGVVGVITAWNFPAYNPARAVAAALAAGCTVVARPSELTPLSAMAMASLLVEAGVPAGAFNLVNGDAPSMGQAMLDHPELRKVSFTGSTRVGRILMDGASRTFTRLALELGGNAPVLVFPDVDVDALARGAAAARFRNNGQVCVAPQRFLVHQRLHEAFAEKVARHVASLRVGAGLDPETQVGPLIHARQRDRVELLVQRAREGGARVVTGGGRPAHPSRGYFFQPTVLADVRPDMEVFTEEIFGPVLPIVPFADLDEALRLANATPYGLAAYVFTRDLSTATRAYERLDVGMVGVNDWTAHATEAPFGGRKASGFGHASGAEGLDEYLEKKLVTLGGID